MKKITLLVVFLLLLSAVSFAIDYNVDIYIRNKPYSGDYVIQNNELYLPIEVLLKNLGFDWLQKGNDIYILSYKSGKMLSDISGVDLAYHYKDKNFKVKNTVKNKEVFVEAKDFARKLEIVAMYNEQTNIFDVVIPNFGAPQITSAPSVSAGGSGSAGSGKKGDPIVATVQSFDNYDPEHQQYGGTVSGTLTVKNTGDKKVSDVVVILYIKNQDEERLNTQTYSIGEMAAGAEVKKDFFWNNPNPLTPTKTETEVKHGKIEGEEEDLKAKSAAGDLPAAQEGITQTKPSYDSKPQDQTIIP